MIDMRYHKSGFASCSKRLAKYNRLPEIEDLLGDDALCYWR